MPPTRSHLFTVKLWLEPLGDGQTEWRGQLRDVESGEIRYFRDLTKLVRCLEEVLGTATRCDALLP